MGADVPEIDGRVHSKTPLLISVDGRGIHRTGRECRGVREREGQCVDFDGLQVELSSLLLLVDYDWALEL